MNVELGKFGEASMRFCIELLCDFPSTNFHLFTAVFTQPVVGKARSREKKAKKMLKSIHQHAKQLIKLLYWICDSAECVSHSAYLKAFIFNTFFSLFC